MLQGQEYLVDLGPPFRLIESVVIQPPHRISRPFPGVPGMLHQRSASVPVSAAVLLAFRTEGGRCCRCVSPRRLVS